MVCIPDGENSLMKCWMSRQNTGVWQTDWQKYGQTDILRRHSPRCAWHRVVKINWLRTSCTVSITTVATWRTQTANFWTDFEQRIIDRAINERQNDYGPVSRLKDCISLSNSHCTLFRYKHCLLRLNGLSLSYQLVIRYQNLFSARKLRRKTQSEAEVEAVHLFVCLSLKCVHKNAIFSKTKQFRAMVSIDDL